MRRRDLLAIKATQQVREGQQGVNCLDGSSVYNQGIKGSGLFFEGDRSIEIYFKYTKQSLKGNWQVLFSFSKDYFQIEVGDGNDKLYFCDGTIYSYIDTLIIGNTYHIVVSMLGKVCTIYVNSIKKSEFETTKSIQNTFVIGRAVSGIDKYCPDIYQCRQYNYALTAPQVTTLYNGGKPEEFVLPTHYKTCEVAHKYSHNFADGNATNWRSVVTTTIINYNSVEKCLDCTTTNDNIDIGIYNPMQSKILKWGIYKFSATFKGNLIPPLYLSIYCYCDHRASRIDSKIYDPINNTTTYYGVCETNPVINTRIYDVIYFYIRYVGGHEIKILSINVEPVVCIAEYLPQNLTTAHDGDASDTTPIAWLDSAKQLPLNDEYLPPLLQSIGGYDLEVGGVPEIIHKPRL